MEKVLFPGMANFLKFKNFVSPVGIGLALVIGGIIAATLHWEHIDKYPYSFPILTLDSIEKPGKTFLENHELNSIGWVLFFLVVGFFDMKD